MLLLHSTCIVSSVCIVGMLKRKDFLTTLPDWPIRTVPCRWCACTHARQAFTVFWQSSSPAAQPGTFQALAGIVEHPAQSHQHAGHTSWQQRTGPNLTHAQDDAHFALVPISKWLGTLTQTNAHTHSHTHSRSPTAEDAVIVMQAPSDLSPVPLFLVSTLLLAQGASLV